MIAVRVRKSGGAVLGSGLAGQMGRLVAAEPDVKAEQLPAAADESGLRLIQPLVPPQAAEREDKWQDLRPKGPLALFALSPVAPISDDQVKEPAEPPLGTARDAGAIPAKGPLER